MEKQEESPREREKRENLEMRERYDKIRILNGSLNIIQTEDYDTEILKDFLKLNLIQKNNTLEFSQYSTEEILRRVLTDYENFVKKITETLSEISEEVPKNHTPSKLAKDKYIRSFQLARLLGVSRAAVTNWVNAGYFDNNFKREGHKVCISHNSIDEFVKQYKKYGHAWRNYVKSGITI